MRSLQNLADFRSRGLMCLWAAVLASITSYAQQYQHTHYTELNGLPSSETYQVFQDRSGFVWIATDNGVVRFDGGNMEIFNRTRGLTDNTVFGMYEDRRGRIWFRTYSGALSYFKLGAIHTYQYNSILQEKLRMSLLNKLVVGENRLWFATNGQGPAGYVDSIGHVTLLERPMDPYSDASLVVYTVEGNEQLTGFVGTPRLTKTIKVNGEEYPVKIDPIFQNAPVAQSLEMNGSIYIAINKALFRYRNKQVTKMATFDSPIINLSIDRSQSLWVGFFGGGVRRFDKENFNSWTTIPQLASLSVSSTLHDAEGGYWFSTLDKGVFYFPNLQIVTGDLAEGNKISMMIDTPDNLYAGDFQGKVMVSDPQLTATKLLLDEPTPISALFLDPKGNLWGASSSGYFKMSPDRKIIFRRQSLQSIRGFFCDSDGAVHAYNSSAVYGFDEAGKLVSRVNMGKRPSRIFFTDSIVYVGSLYGLERFNTQYISQEKSGYLIPGRISVLTSPAPNHLLVGTIGRGAYMIANGKVIRFDETSGFKGESVHAILVTERDVWFATETGILITEKAALLAGQYSWRRISRSSGLLSDKCNFLAKADDRVLAVSDQGYSVFPINMSNYLNDRPRAYVRTLLVNNQEVQASTLELDANRNNISIHTGVVSFNNRKLFLRHRLTKGGDWNYDTNWNISYYAMTPGRYDIEIEASVDQINWYGTTNVIPIEIKVPWWKTWLFQLLVAVVFVTIGYVVYRLRLNAVRRRQSYLELINSHQQRLIDSEIRTQERERKRIATDLHDGVGTSLSSVKLLLSDSINMADHERRARVQEINDNLTDVIAEIKRIVYDLHPPALERYGLQVGLKNLVQRVNNHGGIAIKFDFYGQREVTPQVAIMVYRIMQELISNTLKHARASEIRIHINQFDDEMNIMYEDNGIGMVGSLFNGLGLLSIESRVRTLQGRMSWESNHKGTFYNFDIPF